MKKHLHPLNCEIDNKLFLCKTKNQMAFLYIKENTHTFVYIILSQSVIFDVVSNDDYDDDDDDDDDDVHVHDAVDDCHL